MKYCRDCELYECALRAPLGGCNLDMDNSTPYFNKGVSVVPQFDWQSFRREAAKDILCVCLADQRISLNTPVETTIRMAIQITDDLIEQLKEDNQ